MFVISSVFSNESHVGGLTTDLEEYYCGLCSVGIPDVQVTKEDYLKSIINHLENDIINLMKIKPKDEIEKEFEYHKEQFNKVKDEKVKHFHQGNYSALSWVLGLHD